MFKATSRCDTRDACSTAPMLRAQDIWQARGFGVRTQAHRHIYKVSRKTGPVAVVFVGKGSHQRARFDEAYTPGLELVAPPHDGGQRCQGRRTGQEVARFRDRMRPRRRRSHESFPQAHTRRPSSSSTAHHRKLFESEPWITTCSQYNTGVLRRLRSHKLIYSRVVFEQDDDSFSTDVSERAYCASEACCIADKYISQGVY